MLKSIIWQSWATPTFGGQNLIPGSVTLFFSPKQVNNDLVSLFDKSKSVVILRFNSGKKRLPDQNNFAERRQHLKQHCLTWVTYFYEPVRQIFTIDETFSSSCILVLDSSEALHVFFLIWNLLKFYLDHPSLNNLTQTLA